jgi:hypothetical protein
LESKISDFFGSWANINQSGSLNEKEEETLGCTSQLINRTDTWASYCYALLMTINRLIDEKNEPIL